MGMKKIIKAIEAHVQNKVDDAYSEGYDDGCIDSDIQYGRGVRDERDRIINMFKMMSDMEMENGSASKAKQYYDAAALVKIADDMVNLDFSPEGLEKWNQEDNEKQGF